MWVLGGIERTPERKVFLVAVPDRSQSTLENIISRHVYPGSIILTDLWRGYSRLADNFDYTHHTVNHSVNICRSYYFDAYKHDRRDMGWHQIGYSRRNRVAGEIDNHLFEFIWHRVHENNLWVGYLNALRDIAFD